MARGSLGFLILLHAFLISCVEGVLYSCGNAMYDPTKVYILNVKTQDPWSTTGLFSPYTCFSGNFLCPIIGGQEYFPCKGACYSPASYSCANGQLGPPVRSNTFTITVSWPQTVDDMLPLEAFSGGFIFGPGITTASSYCPSSVGTGCPVGNQTVFTADGGAMDVEVPGGQQVYVAPNGALSFTQAHSANYPPGSQFGGFGGSGGEFVYAGPNKTAGWIACPVNALDFSPPLNYIYQIYADIPSHPTRYPNNGPIFVCYNVTLLLDLYTGGFGAWQYA